MSRRVTIKVFTYNELAEIPRKQAIAQLKDHEVTEVLAVLESGFTESGLYIPPAFLSEAA